MSPSRVIRSYLVISGIFTLSASLIWGINTLFLLDAGLTIFEVFVANAAFTAAMALFEIPTGVVADTRGRRASFLLSEAIICDRHARVRRRRRDPRRAPAASAWPA